MNNVPKLSRYYLYITFSFCGCKLNLNNFLFCTLYRGILYFPYILYDCFNLLNLLNIFFNLCYT